MKSPLVENAEYLSDEQKDRYSDLQVMVSGAGYYIGTYHMDPSDNFSEPGSRDSVEYYATREAAQEALDKRTFTQRRHP